MLFRRLKLDWRYGISELLIVVCGVLIALAAEGWRQDLQDRSSEREYVERLRRDIAVDTVTLSSVMEQTRERAAYATSVIRVFDTGEAFHPPEEFVRAVEYANWFGYPTYSRTTIEDLQSTGNLSLLRDTGAMETVWRYYAMIDFFDQFRGLFRPMQVALAQAVPGFLRPGTRGALFNEAISSSCLPNMPCNSGIPWESTTLEVTAAEAELVLGRLLAHKDARALYAEMGRIQGMHYANLSDIRALAVVTLETLGRYGEPLACPPKSDPGRMRVQRPEEGGGLEDAEATHGGAGRPEAT